MNIAFAAFFGYSILKYAYLTFYYHNAVFLFFVVFNGALLLLILPTSALDKDRQISYSLNIRLFICVHTFLVLLYFGIFGIPLLHDSWYSLEELSSSPIKTLLVGTIVFSPVYIVLNGFRGSGTSWLLFVVFGFTVLISSRTLTVALLFALLFRNRKLNFGNASSGNKIFFSRFIMIIIGISALLMTTMSKENEDIGSAFLSIFERMTSIEFEGLIFILNSESINYRFFSEYRSYFGDDVIITERVAALQRGSIQYDPIFGAPTVSTLGTFHALSGHLLSALLLDSVFSLIIFFVFLFCKFYNKSWLGFVIFIISFHILRTGVFLPVLFSSLIQFLPALFFVLIFLKRRRLVS